MRIVLSQNEIELAIRDVISQQIVLRDDQGIVINFEDAEDDTITAVVTFAKVERVAVNEVPGKPRGRPRKEVTPVVETDQADLSQDTVQVPLQADTAGSVTKIFPNPVSSAPTAEPTPAGLAKSLFSNLQKPVNE